MKHIMILAMYVAFLHSKDAATTNYRILAADRTSLYNRSIGLIATSRDGNHHNCNNKITTALFFLVILYLAYLQVGTAAINERIEEQELGDADALSTGNAGACVFWKHGMVACADSGVMQLYHL